MCSRGQRVPFGLRYEAVRDVVYKQIRRGRVCILCAALSCHAGCGGISVFVDDTLASFDASEFVEVAEPASEHEAQRVLAVREIRPFWGSFINRGSQKGMTVGSPDLVHDVVPEVVSAQKCTTIFHDVFADVHFTLFLVVVGAKICCKISSVVSATFFVVQVPTSRRGLLFFLARQKSSGTFPGGWRKKNVVVGGRIVALQKTSSFLWWLCRKIVGPGNLIVALVFWGGVWGALQGVC